MIKDRFQRFEEFFNFYQAAQGLPRGEAYAGEGTDHLHWRASRKLFEQSLPFLENLPWPAIQTALDVGMGYGFHCEYFAAKGVETTGLTAHLTDEIISRAARAGYRPLAMDMHFLDFEDSTFDLVFASHSLEHSFSPLFALWEWRRVLKPGGWLAVTVPPHQLAVVSGHYTTGWSVGQLIYLLGVAGFALQEGSFEHQGYNVRALVRKPAVEPSPDGRSFLHVIAPDLPAPIRAALQPLPASLGRFRLPAAILRADDRELIWASGPPKPAVSGLARFLNLVHNISRVVRRKR